MMSDELGWRLGMLPLILLLDHLFRDPVRVMGMVHPVIVMGNAISRVERLCATQAKKPIAQLLMGGVAVVLVLLVLVLPVMVLEFVAGAILDGWLKWIFGVAVAAWLIAARGLYDHVEQVRAHVAQNDVPKARAALINLAGRKTDRLDTAAVLRTAGESLAENFSDAVVAPLSYYVLFGLPGIVAYKAINSLDSMWGYRNERYLYFGRLAARLDDVANLIPARLSALLLLLAGLGLRRVPYLESLRTVWADARRHPSPNAGYPEAAMAGLAGLRFGGPREYDGDIIETTWLCSGREDWRTEDLDFCLCLYRCAITVLVLSTGVIMIVYGGSG
ncbi:MAG: cobalamin biosynthesis protein CobD [Alphaproteobacteria bacterium]|nr:cobalamin biosynthesis protein CobD [Alphaproteobacteria bacterium]